MKVRIMIIKFNDQTIIIEGDLGCELLREANDCVVDFDLDVLDEKENKYIRTVTIDRDSKFFVNFIMKDFELKKLKPKKISYIFENLGFYGADEKIKKLRRNVRNLIVDKYQQRKKVVEFFRKHKTPTDLLARNPNFHPDDLSENDLSENDLKNPNIMTYMSHNPNLKIDFIRKYSDKLDWHKVVRYCKFTPKEALELKDELGWNCFLYGNQFISEEFIEDELKIMDPKSIRWNCLADNKHLSENFFRKYIEHFKNYLHNLASKNLSESFFEFIIPMVSNNDFYFWEELSYNKNLSSSFLIKYFKLGKFNYDDIFENRGIDEKFVEYWIEENKDVKSVPWKIISDHVDMSLEFIKKYENYIVWASYATNFNAIESVIRDHMKDLYDKKNKSYSLGGIHRCKRLSMKFFKDYINIIPEIVLSQCNLEVDFIEKHIEKFSIYTLSSNTFKCQRDENEVIEEYLNRHKKLKMYM